jgi:hypothetical protein
VNNELSHPTLQTDFYILFSKIVLEQYTEVLLFDLLREGEASASEVGDLTRHPLLKVALPLLIFP